MLPETKAMVWPRIYILPTIFAIASCYQIIFIDYPYGHDWIFELVRLNEYYDSIKSGQILPYWSNNLYFGFGSPIFIYYAPLYNIVSSVVIVIGSSLKTSAVISLILFMMIAAIGMAGLLWESNKNNTKPEILMACRIGAIAYVLSPYLLSNLLIRNASAELAALCLAPYPFWGLVMLYNNKKKGIIFLAIGTALSILSHNLTALTITALLLTGSIILFLYYRDLGKLYYSIFSIITGIAITTWFWLPALYLKSEVRIHEMTAGKFAFENNFLSLADMIGFDQFYSFGFFPIVVLILSLLTLIISKPRSKLTFYIFTCSMLFLFLQSDISYILWNNLIFLELFQFPWRMMGPFSFCMAVLLGICLSRIKLKPYITEFIFVLFIIINCFPVFQKYEPIPENISNNISKTITSEEILLKGLPATVLDEYLPNNSDISILNQTKPGALFLSSQFKNYKPISIENGYIHIEVDTEQDMIILPTYWYFPVWKVLINNIEQPINISKWGTLEIALPTGKLDLKLILNQPDIRITGVIISGISLLIFCFIFFRIIRNTSSQSFL